MAMILIFNFDQKCDSLCYKLQKFLALEAANGFILRQLKFLRLIAIHTTIKFELHFAISTLLKQKSLQIFGQVVIYNSVNGFYHQN